MSPRPQAGSNSEGIDNFQLPKALVTRIAKSVLPHDAKLQKDTINTLVNGATVFINYLAATAQDVAYSRSRKTITSPDILKALEIIDFGDLVPLLEDELDLYQGVGKTDKGKGKASDVKAKGKEKEPSPAASDTLDMQPNISYSANEGHHGGHEREPAAEMLGNVDELGDGGNDEDVGMVEVEAEVEVEGEVEGRDEEEEEQEDEVEEEEADEEVEDDVADEELVDMMAVEETEIQKDQRGLEESLFDDGKGVGVS